MMKIKYLPFLFLAASCSDNQKEENTAIEADETQTETSVKTQDEQEKPEVKSYCMVHSLNVRPTAGIKGEVIYQLGLSEEVVKTGNVSEETYKATFRGTEYDKPWVEVKTESGITGWVHGGALNDEPISIDEKLTADYYNTPDKRKEWWNNLSSTWKRIFNITVLGSNEYNQPSDKEIEKILTATSMTVGPDEGCGNYAYEFDVKDLSGLKCLSNLESLDISTIELDNLDQIGHLTNLTSLSANYCKLKSLSGIGSLKKLTHLSFSGNEIGSLNQLIGHTKLNTLFADNCGIKDISGMRNLSQLRNLYISSNPISNYETFARLDSLSDLDLEGPRTENLNFVKHLTKLKNFKFLSIRYCENITDLTPLKSLKKLERVNIGYIRINDLSPIEHVKTIYKNYEYTPDNPYIPTEEVERVKSLGIEVYEQEEICGC